MSSLLVTRASLSLSLAMHALQAALVEAESLRVKISVMIVDAAGNALLMAHMDDAPGLSREIAKRKAATALSFGVSTADWDARLQSCSPGLRRGLALQAGMALFGGGEPFRHEGSVIGAIGISGSSEQLDRQCAQAAVQCVEAFLAQA